MRLAIADPPYLGRGKMLYGANALAFPGKMRAEMIHKRVMTGDGHEHSADWDDEATHEEMIERLTATYDGWAIAMNSDNLAFYLPRLPNSTRVAAWCRPDAFPAGRVVRSWEPVAFLPPNGVSGGPGTLQRRDYLIAAKSTGASSSRFVGAKPAEWTRWVLDMLGYNPDTDTVDDLFPGSGAVTAAINQGTLL